ncbi:hypothetical protein NGM44_01815 [Moraxella sp. FZFQ2102]|uniref:hypothetical protein n=1 Tax=Moraxella sp. FZFQ2102 TaxID=2953752 RepID=UPI00209C0F88|nr:hypothetical protein [Moraxella sp. FZFQ2102]USZ15157.1 hypothetical protein NGM44_01815 [Moraxella sp. FZFQ2102]
MISLNNKIHLSNLKNNRHAVAGLSADDFTHFRQELLTCLQVDDIRDDTWYLIGTDGCHLCQDAQTWLGFVLKTVTPSPALIRLEIMNTQDITLLDSLGKYLPILITPNQLLCYPFSVMDVQRILMK